MNDVHSVLFPFRIENLLPRNWVPIPRDDRRRDVTVHLLKLAKSSAEYQDVAKRFYETVQIEKIVSIERIQIPSFTRLTNCGSKKYGGNNELQLFHGTNAVNVTQINTQGFNRSLTGYDHGESFELMGNLCLVDQENKNTYFEQVR